MIRGALASDLTAILGVRSRAVACYAPSAYTPEETATLLDDVDKAELLTMIDDRQLFVAERDGTVIGTAGWLSDTLRHCYVEPSESRRAIGSRLVGHAESDFAARSDAGEITARGRCLRGRLLSG